MVSFLSLVVKKLVLASFRPQWTGFSLWIHYTPILLLCQSPKNPLFSKGFAGKRLNRLGSTNLTNPFAFWYSRLKNYASESPGFEDTITVKWNRNLAKSAGKMTNVKIVASFCVI